MYHVGNIPTAYDFMVLNLALIDSQHLRFRVFILLNHPGISWLFFCLELKLYMTPGKKVTWN